MTYQAASAVLPVLAVCCGLHLTLMAGRAVWRAGHRWYRVAAVAAAVAAGTAAAALYAVPAIQDGLLTAATGPQEAAAAFFVPAAAVVAALTVMFVMSVSAGHLSPYQVLRRVTSGIVVALSGLVVARVVAGAWQASSADGRWAVVTLGWLIAVAAFVLARRRPVHARPVHADPARTIRPSWAVQRNHPELADTARHEAAHAVVARVLGLDVAGVDIQATHARLGVTTVDAPPACVDALYDLMTVFLAADVAVVAGRGPELGAEDDVPRAASAALTIVARAGTPTVLPPDTAVTLEQLMRSARARAADLLARHHRATAGLIERLLADPGRPVTRAELEYLVPIQAPEHVGGLR